MSGPNQIIDVVEIDVAREDDNIVKGTCEFAAVAPGGSCTA
jgi:hypothetical protein